MNETTQDVIKKLLDQIKKRDDLIEKLTRANEVQGVRQKEIKRKYKNTVLLLSVLLSVSVIGNILLLLK
jgi:hypothetical protein